MEYLIICEGRSTVVVIGTLADAKETADAGARYNPPMHDIIIKTGINEEYSRRVWHDEPYRSSGGELDFKIIDFGEYGFYDIWDDDPIFD